MNTFYFLAAVANATSSTVRIAVLAKNRAFAFVKAATVLRDAGLDMISMQNLAHMQYAVVTSPLPSEVATSAVVTESPLNPV